MIESYLKLYKVRMKNLNSEIQDFKYFFAYFGAVKLGD